MSRKKKEKFLHPGQFFFGDSNNRVGTLLGSCIAMCLWHPILKIGGMCHFVLPTSHGPESNGLNGRYAIDAMEMFRQSVRMKNSSLKEYQGFIYGGANMIASLANSEEDSIGMRNAGVAMKLLASDQVTIMVVDVGETWSRRISFDIASGEIDVKKQGQTFLSK